MHPDSAQKGGDVTYLNQNYSLTNTEQNTNDNEDEDVGSYLINGGMNKFRKQTVKVLKRQTRNSRINKKRSKYR